MSQKRLMVVSALAGVLVIGGGCFSKTAVETGTNTGVTVTTNTSVTPNSGGTTGAFDTSGAAIVTFSSSGVSPSPLTVSSGTTVKFINNDAVTHEIAANPHPAHTDLPGFQGTIGPSGSYSFTFTTTGSFGYHDHLDPFNGRWKGTVVVQ